MTQPYYDAKRYQKIENLYKTNPWLGKQLMANYLNEYPYDFLARAMYVRMAIIIFDLEEAKKASQESLEVFYNYRKSHLPQDTIDRFKREMIHHEIRIKFLEEDYENALKLVRANKLLFNHDYYMEMLLYLRKKLGLESGKRVNQSRYLKRQITEYDFEDFLTHLSRHLQINDKNENMAIFRYNFPIKKALEEILNKLQTPNRYTTNPFTDTYQFQYDICGHIGRKNADAFFAVFLHDTNQLIAMYPSLNYSKEHAMDMNTLNGSPNPELILQRKTQIEKFNERYPKIA